MTIAEPPPFEHLTSPAVTTLSPQHLEQIAAARQRGKRIKRCASTANFSAGTMAFFGALTLIGSAIGSWIGMGLGAVMCVLSHFEFRGAKEMRRLDINAPKRLALNQVILMVMLLTYSVAFVVGRAVRAKRTRQSHRQRAGASTNARLIDRRHRARRVHPGRRRGHPRMRRCGAVLPQSPETYRSIRPWSPRGSCNSSGRG